MENYAQLYELNIRMWRVQQGHRDVTSYYTERTSIWQGLDLKAGEGKTVKIVLVLGKM